MQLPQLLTRVYEYLTCSLRSYTQDEQEFIRSWQNSQHLDYYRAIASLLIYILAGAWIAQYFRSPLPQRPIELTTYGIMFAAIALWRLNKRLRKTDPRHLFAFVGIVLLIGSSASVHVLLDAPTTTASIVMVTGYLIGSMVFFTVMFPYADARILAVLPFNLGVAYFAFMNLSDGGTVWVPFQLLLAYSAMAIGVSYSRIYRARREILAEFRMRGQLLQNERLRIEVVEQQIALANEIQDSLTPPEEFNTPFGATAKFYQKKFHPLGGDWMAVRTLSTGQTIFVVADVTGKGVEAALVVHAVQSLWAQTLSSPTFDFVAWLHSLNNALVTLGKKKLHTLTIGMLVMSADSLTYYSAGHIPCYVLAGDDKMHQILASGNIVGFDDELDLSPVSFKINPRQSYKVILGTDGALNKGTRMRQSDLKRLVSEVDEMGGVALSHKLSDDDQLLISITVPLEYGLITLTKAV